MDQGKKKESNKVILQVDKSNSQETELDLINVFSFMGKRKRLIVLLLCLSIVLGCTIGAFYSGFEHLVGKGSYARALISFQFDGIQNGHDPNGAAFDVNQIKSPYVIQSALAELGIEDGYIEKVRENISIEGVVPKDALERITITNKMAEKDPKYYEQLLDVSYFPSQYVVYLSDDGTFKQGELVQILDSVIASYKNYFLDTYANATVLSVTSNLLSEDDYDYGESINLLKTQLRIMLSYVREKRSEAPDFRASSTGLSFQDIVTALEFVNTVDIARVSAHVQSKSLTRDKSKQVDYYEYLIRDTINNISETQTKLDTVTRAITAYEKDPVIVVSNTDSTLEYGEKNEYYDALVNQQLSLNNDIAAYNTTLNEYYVLLNNLTDSDAINDQEDYDYADSLLAGINTTMASWIDLIEQTTEEYYSTTRFSNAVTVVLPAQYFIEGGIVHIIKNMAIPTAALIAFILIWWFYHGVKDEIRAQRAKDRERTKIDDDDQDYLDE